MAKKFWIADAIKKPGALRKTLKVKKGKIIPKKKLKTAAKKKGKVGARARLALTLKSFSKKKTIKKKTKSRAVPKTSKVKRKIGIVMGEFKKGTLPIGKSKKKVKSRKQAVAIALSEARKAG